MRLAETIALWLGRAQVVLTGAEGSLREGEDALASGDFMRARAQAHEILARVPDSPLGLALLADACEMGGLDAELAMTLEDLARRVPSRADVWVRLARARHATGAADDDVRDAHVRALAVAEPGSEARREALIALADLDLSHDDGARADMWLERIAGEKRSDVALRRAEARLARGDAKGALVWLDSFEAAATDGRAALARGRALAMSGDAAAFPPLLRALVLDVPKASESLASTVAWIASDTATRGRVRTVVEARGEAGLARWRAAFARAEGRLAEAREALRDAVATGDATAARPLLDAALDDRDGGALAQSLLALADADDPIVRDARRIHTFLDSSRLDDLHAVASERALPWADALLATTVRAWLPAVGAADWSALLSRLDAHARALHDLDATARIAALSAERRRPVRVAIVGEFNAGKSTFINALIGADVAPTGVLPTTATLHHLRYAPDPIARILFVPGSEPPERIVPVGDLRATLRTCDAQSIRRVEILLPIASLTRVEILDTPGFNAPDQRHTEAARAAFEEADAAIWLLDAGQPMKRTERDVLDEARAARLPVQILVNKADRLAPADRETVMRAVDEGLAEAGFVSWSAPVALSARQALLGKLGDAAALAASNWPEVLALLDAQIVARSDELKERALRRRALQVVAVLGQGAARRADEERARAESRRQRAEAAARMAAQIDRDAEEVARRIESGLAAAASAWQSDLTMLATGRDPQAVATDPSLLRYRVDRALARLARPLAQSLAAAADAAHVTPADLTPAARAIVRTFADAADSAGLAPLARAAVSALVEHLAARAEAEAREATPASGIVRELTALAAALG